MGEKLPNLPKRQTGWATALIALVCLVAAAFSSCQLTIGTEVSNAPRTVVYSVSGTSSSAKISYTNETGGTTTVENFKDNGLDMNGNMRWSKLVTLPAGTMAYISAQNDLREGTVRVEIEWSGGVGSRPQTKSSESSGEYCIATASM